MIPSLVCKIHAAGDAAVDMDSDEENLPVLLLRRRRRRPRRQQRLLWTHPLTADRLTSGQFYTITIELKQDSCKLHNYFRMSKNSFDELLSLLKTHIGKAHTLMRKSIPAEERLAISLRWVLLANSAKFWIDSGTVVDYHQMMSPQMYTGRCTDEFEERRMGEIRHTRPQEILCLYSDSGEMASVEL
ncbi:hypothetical protein PR048_000110 [Dryococelus australis]|uniref:Uncharacterized protein n=1 Tax=Dryococelus australis TaxID=614101 RepID=A0ABQ9IFY1_9NEOP|nr:hypothetical protein PR048_000110 [Dryococelus australis]